MALHAQGANLSELETHILHRLASATVTLSSVALAAELWEDTIGNPFTFDMVHWILKDLNERGFVTYREGYSEVPVDIRVTDHGYVTLGYEQRHQMPSSIKRFHREDSMRPGDGTDFRNHKFWAEWSPCERMSIADHHHYYPDHPHPDGWGQEESMATAQMIGSRSQNGEEIKRLMAERGLTEGRARRVARSQKAERLLAGWAPVPVNQKSLILNNLLTYGKAQNVHDLRLRLQKESFTIDPHNLVHALWAIQKDGHVSFRERNRTPVSWEGNLTAITLSARGTEAAEKLSNVKQIGDSVLSDVKNFRPMDDLGGAIRAKFIEQAVTDSKETSGSGIQHVRGDDRFDYLEKVTVAEQVEAARGANPPIQMVPVEEEVNGIAAPLKETVEPPIDFFVEFPLIGKMINRQARLESAAQILEEEGQADLALATLEKIQFTPFEKEVLSLVKKVQ